MIAGFTDYDTNPTALDVIFQEWTSNAPFTVKQMLLSSGVLGVHLDSSTVHTDSYQNNLDGGGGMDWPWS